MGQFKRALIMAGGTGGHVFPGLAIADYLREQGIEVHWLGTALGLEARVVPKANIPLHLIPISGLRGKGLGAKLLAPWRILKATWLAKKIVQSVDPDIVIGLGGFASGPGGMASWLCKKPLLIHEQNAIAGFTNKCLAPIAARILVGFPGTFGSKNKVVPVGNPVRQDLLHLLPPKERLQHHDGHLKLLVLGGSLGAAALNKLVPAALKQLPPALRPVVTHQAGDKHLDATIAAYQSANVDAKIVPFIDNMKEVYAAADMVLCRAGALTIAELCAVGLGALFVPYPYAVDDHQTANAAFMVKNKAAYCRQEASLTADELATMIKQLVQSPERCLEMAQAAYQLRNDRVVEHIFHICEEVCH